MSNNNNNTSTQNNKIDDKISGNDVTISTPKNIKIVRVKMSYFDHFFSKPLKVPCFHQYYGDFFFKWRLNTGTSFMKDLMTIQPTKFYISSETEIEKVTSKKNLFLKMMKLYNKLGNEKIDKFEIISVIPFIVENNFEKVLFWSLKYFCLENEQENETQDNLKKDIPEHNIITKCEFGLFLDCFFRAVHCISDLDENDEVYQKTKDNLIKIAENELDDALDKIFVDDKNQPIEELELMDLIKKIPENISTNMKNINKGFYDTLLYYEMKIIKSIMLPAGMMK